MYPEAKKSLGQNFLNGGRTIEHIVDCMDVITDFAVLEIGPGRGVLTKELLKKGFTVYAVETDRDLIKILQQELQAEIALKKLILIEGDITNFDYEKFIPEKFQIVANIPFYITGMILRRIFEGSTILPQKVCLIMQKEVAKRIVKDDGDSSILSHSIELYGTAKYVKTISRGSFSPAPKVDGGLLCIYDIHTPEISCESSEFFELVKTLYHMPRKTIRNNLFETKFEIILKNLSEEMLQRRPETLTLGEIKKMIQ